MMSASHSGCRQESDVKAIGSNVHFARWCTTFWPLPPLKVDSHCGASASGRSGTTCRDCATVRDRRQHPPQLIRTEKSLLGGRLQRGAGVPSFRDVPAHGAPFQRLPQRRRSATRSIATVAPRGPHRPRLRLRGASPAGLPGPAAVYSLLSMLVDL